MSDLSEKLGTDLLGAPVLHRTARFHSSHERIALSREWGPGPRALVIGCNPSTADGTKDDPTSRWWNNWFIAHGFGGYDAMNLYPFCTSSPKECREIVERINAGLDYGARDSLHFVNLPTVVSAAKAAAQVFVCWGAIAWDDMWIDHVVEEIQTGEAPYPDLWCWGKTASGAPKHPLARGVHRIDPSQAPIMWRAGNAP
jgi:hypothetical protein